MHILLQQQHLLRRHAQILQLPIVHFCPQSFIISNGFWTEPPQSASPTRRTTMLTTRSWTLQLPTAWPARLPSRPGRHWVVRAKDKRCTAADDVAQAPGQHISRMGLKVVPMIAPFSNLCAVNISGNFMGKHCRCRSVRSTEHCQLLLHQTIVLSVSLDGFSKQGGV